LGRASSLGLSRHAQQVQLSAVTETSWPVPPVWTALITATCLCNAGFMMSTALRRAGGQRRVLSAERRGGGGQRQAVLGARNSALHFLFPASPCVPSAPCSSTSFPGGGGQQEAVLELDIVRRIPPPAFALVRWRVPLAGFWPQRSPAQPARSTRSSTLGARNGASHLLPRFTPAALPCSP
jgi:hypothetical protein